MDYQKRFIDVPASIKAIGNGSDEYIFEGYGSVFGNIDSYGDIVEKGAFDKSLQEHGMPSLLLHHDARQVVGVYTDAYSDEHGLKVTGKLTKGVRAAEEAHLLMKDGALRGLSIGFIPKVVEYDKAHEVHRIKEVELMEVSIVTFPANREAEITGVKHTPKTERELEFILRDAGYSRKQAKAIVADGYKGLNDEQRDAVSKEDLMAALLAELKG